MKPYYWKRAPHLDKLILSKSTNTQSRYKLLLTLGLIYNRFCFCLCILNSTDKTSLSKHSAFDVLVEPVRVDFELLLSSIKTQTHSTAQLVNTITDHLFSQGGKCLRPLMLLLCARACGYQGKDHITLGTVIEYIHTATLLHDDVVDNSALRRGKPTAHTRFGNEAAILVGDFLYSRAFQLMTHTKQLRVMDCFANTTNCLAEGEAQQLLNRHNPELSQANYLKIIQSKTAKLFETAAQLGAILAEMPEAVEAGLANYGLQVGLAFQIVDDILDYQSDDKTLGKNPLQDLKEGKVTLPLLYLYEQGSVETKALIRSSILSSTPTQEQINAIKVAIRHSDAIQQAYTVAEHAVNRAIAALSVLPNSTFKEGAIALARYALSRLQ
ncbi:MAG: octaprenyl diphosphate synthase [Pseudomonadota bacterium]|jgi:octaprenyl-diphosphate synthase